jgi:hypothetical protein
MILMKKLHSYFSNWEFNQWLAFLVGVSIGACLLCTITYQISSAVPIIIVGIPAAAWFLREVLKLVLSKDLEKFKFDLEIETATHKIRYEKLHSERMEVIKKVYQKLSTSNRDFRNLVAPFQNDSSKEAIVKRKAAVATSAMDLINYFEENRIFFNESLAVQLDNLLLEFQDIWADFQLVEDLRLDDTKESVKVWIETWNRLNKDVPKIKSALENEFRSIIGIDS